MERYDELAKLLAIDAREKKKAGRGVFHRATRTGALRGGMKTASSFITKSEIKKLSGEVVIYNMYDNMTWKELVNMSETRQKEVLTKLIEAGLSRQDIADKYGVTKSAVQNKTYRLGIKSRTTSTDDADKVVSWEKSEETKTTLPALPEARYVPANMFSVMFNGLHSCEDIQDKLNAISLILKDNKKYTISLSISEDVEEDFNG